MKGMKLTRWIGGKHKPVRVGVYERRSETRTGFTLYCKWTGAQWIKGNFTPEEAAQQAQPSVMQSLPWRGLAEKP